jgi:hypothetical protein
MFSGAPGNTLHQARRVDDSKIGILSSSEEEPGVPRLVLRQLLDLDDDDANIIDIPLSHDDALVAAESSLNAMFLPVGDQGGTVLGDVRWVASYRAASDSRYRAVFGYYQGEAVLGYTFTDPADSHGDVSPALMIRDGDRTHVFMGAELPASHHYVVPDAGGIVAPREWPAEPMRAAGAIARSDDGAINAAGVVAALTPELRFESFVGKVPDGALEELEIPSLTSIGTIADASQVVVAGGTAQEWLNENFVLVGHPLNDGSRLALRIHHVTGQQRFDATWRIAEDLSLPAGAGIKAVAFTSGQPRFFGFVEDTLRVVALLDAGDHDEIFLVRIRCAVDAP